MKNRTDGLVLGFLLIMVVFAGMLINNVKKVFKNKFWRL